MRERDKRLIREIRRACREGRLIQPFAPRDIRDAGVSCAPNTPGTFLPKHCVGNPDGNTELFVRIARGRYVLKQNP